METPALPKPFHWEPQTAALVYIDMQRDFLEPGGFGAALGNKVSLLSTIVPGMELLLKAWRAAGLPVIHTLECHEPDLSDCPPAKWRRGNPGMRIGDPGERGRILVKGEEGNAIIDSLSPAPGELVIYKPGKGAFYQTNLERELRQRRVEQLIVGGVTTEVCVQTTLREANDRGYDCLLVEDATASYFPQFKQAVLEMVVSQGGIVGWTSTIASIVASLVPLFAGRAKWQEIRPGVEKLSLALSPSQSELALLRYRPGATVGLHEHPGQESILVLQGSQRDDRGAYGVGSVVVNPPGSRHQVASDEGCLILINWDQPVRFL